ncbi:MAG TPA: hypothetical protein VF088_04315 [Pyrinomonadaceae bacterium]
MKLNAEELYASIRQLSPKERLRLAVMILNEMIANDDTVDYSDIWTDQDIQDLTAFALSHSENPHEKHRNKP